MGIDRKKRTSVIASNEDTTNDIQVEVYNDFDILEPLQQQWDDFVRSVSGDIFMTYDWCRIWWKYYGKNRSLRIFVFRQEGALVGIIPLFFEKIWLGPVFVRAVKIVGSDFTIAQFSVPVSIKYIRGIIQKLFELLPEDKWDILHIGPIAGMYRDFDELDETFKKIAGGSFIVQTGCSSSVQTYFKLTNSWEKQLVELKKKQRQTVRRNYRKIRNEGYSLVARFVGVEHFTEKFSKFTKMHQLHWRKRHKLGHFGDWPASLEFHREVARSMLSHGRLRLLEVSAGNLCIGYQYAYKLGDKLYSLLSARSTTCKLANVAVGNVIYCEQMKEAIRENVKYIDSMQGKYEHKLRLGGRLFPVRSIYIVPKKLLVSVRVFLFRALAKFLDLCYYRIWFCRVAPELPFTSMSLWKKWICTRAFR